MKINERGLQKIMKIKIVLLYLFITAITILPAYSQQVVTDNINNPVGIAYAENVIKKTESYIKTKNFVAAQKTLDEVYDWIMNAAEYHTDLFMTLRKVDTAQAQSEIERNLAIKFASVRDNTLFLQAQIYINQGLKYKAVKNLVEIVRSQPDSELGFKAYKKLQEIGFTYGVEAVPVKSNVIQHTTE